jgi:uncharacterized protein
MGLGVVGIAVVGFAAFMAGLSRTGIPGLGLLCVPLVALVMPALPSMGLLLVLFVTADLMSIFYLRRSVSWARLLRVLPWTLVGVGIGFLAMRAIGQKSFNPIVGGMIIAVVGLDFLRRKAGIEFRLESRIFAACMGVLAGIFTMMANAAGPIMTVYLLSMRMPKENFVGTSAYFYFIVNCVKVPLSVFLGIITTESLRLDLMVAPLVALGCVAGVFVVRRVPERHFSAIMQGLAALGGIKLLF